MEEGGIVRYVQFSMLAYKIIFIPSQPFLSPLHSHPFCSKLTFLLQLTVFSDSTEKQEKKKTPDVGFLQLRYVRSFYNFSLNLLPVRSRHFQLSSSLLLPLNLIEGIFTPPKLMMVFYPNIYPSHWSLIFMGERVKMAVRAIYHLIYPSHELLLG